jgi:hypothetical protein
MLGSSRVAAQLSASQEGLSYLMSQLETNSDINIVSTGMDLNIFSGRLSAAFSDEF